VAALLLAASYFVLTVILPLFNRVMLKGWTRFDTVQIGGYPYPLTATWLQLLGSAVVLVVIDAAMHFFPNTCQCTQLIGRYRAGPSVNENRDDKHGSERRGAVLDRAQLALMRRSWVFQRDWQAIKVKLWFLLPVAATFAAVMALTNVGLFQIQVDLHLLLRSSEIIWVVAFAWLVIGERPSWKEMLCAAVMIGGTVMLSIDWSDDDSNDLTLNPWPLIINLGSTVVGGLMLVLLRRACVNLSQIDPTITIIEITAIKMIFATLFVLPFSIALEPKGWAAFSMVFDDTMILVLGGVVLTMVYQTVVVALTTFTLATTVGILAQAKVVPQVLLAILLFGGFVPTALKIAGLVLVSVASIFYGVLRYFVHRRMVRLQEWMAYAHNTDVSSTEDESVSDFTETDAREYDRIIT
jgi:UAA transporter family